MLMLWKLLRQHISAGQLTGFCLANLFGMYIVLLGWQFSRDVLPTFNGDDGIIKNTYIILSKHISAVSTLSGETVGFSEDEIQELKEQSFVKRVGAFTASHYRVYASLDKGNGMQMGTDMFFESVPDEFVDTKLSKWTFTPEDTEIPIILPRSYLALYNFGFAQSQQLPKLSEGVVSMIQLDIFLQGTKAQKQFKGRVVGFSNRLNTILVPEKFMQWSNEALGNSSKSSVFSSQSTSSSSLPTRLIVEVSHPTDTHIASYVEEHGYEATSDSLDAGKTTFFLKVIISIVIAIGLLISALSFYILMLSVYLLIQKNATKLQTLLLIGYSHANVCKPYILLTCLLNLGVLVLSVLLVLLTRSIYLDTLWQMFPLLEPASILPMMGVGLSLLVLVSLLNIIVIRNKINTL